MSGKNENPQSGDKDNDYKISGIHGSKEQGYGDVKAVVNLEKQLSTYAIKLSRMTSMEADAIMYENIQNGWTKILDLLAEPWDFNEEEYDNIVNQLHENIKKVNDSKNVKDIVAIGCEKVKVLCVNAKIDIWEIVLDEDNSYDDTTQDGLIAEILKTYSPKIGGQLDLLTAELTKQ